MAEGQAAVKAFERIIAWVTKHKKAKAILPSLNKPATAKAIVEFEAKTKLKLPESMVAIYRLHDGQNEDALDETVAEAIGLESIEAVEGREEARAGAPVQPRVRRGVRRRSKNTSSTSPTDWSRRRSSGTTRPACRTRRGGTGTG